MVQIEEMCLSKVKKMNVVTSAFEITENEVRIVEKS